MLGFVALLFSGDGFLDQLLTGPHEGIQDVEIAALLSGSRPGGFLGHIQ